jgi:hypothetical protein
MDAFIYPLCLAVGLLFAIISALAGAFFGGHAEVVTGQRCRSRLPCLGVRSPASMPATNNLAQ